MFWVKTPTNIRNSYSSISLSGSRHLGIFPNGKRGKDPPFSIGGSITFISANTPSRSDS